MDPLVLRYDEGCLLRPVILGLVINHVRKNVESNVFRV